MLMEEAIDYLTALCGSDSTSIDETIALEMAINALKNPIIEIDGKKYIAENPQLKTLHKDGEVVIGGFRALDEYELCWQMGAKDESLNCDVCPHSCKEVKNGEE